MSDWQIVNLNLIAKSIGELCYEQILTAVKISDDQYAIDLKTGVQYTFKAWMGIWDHMRVDPKSIKKKDTPELTAGQFFIDAKDNLEMTDIVLGNFLEEMHNSLFGDLALLVKQKGVSADSMANMSGEEVQAYLNGHPKILLSKGRVGWGVEEMDNFAPESEKGVRLHWIAVRKDFVESSFDDQIDTEKLLLESFDKSEMDRFDKILKEKNINFEDFYFMPVHPWQWNRFINIQYHNLVVAGNMVSLGILGDKYVPQISIRTLSNLHHPEKLDIKLPLTILNTSAVRGIPARYISIGAKLSRHLLSLCHEDELLKKYNTDVLVEKAGMSVKHELFSQISEVPYRYNEFLGAVWRESMASKQGPGELTILTGSLFYQDLEGNSLIGAYIKKSGLSKQEWLKQYFTVVILPLYHLQLKYGLGLVSHGQNIILKMKNFRPHNVILKDFQGDLRLAQKSILLERPDFSEIAEKLDKLPANYLIHDLMTGHMVTVLRFVSEVMFVSVGLEEIEFYKILAMVVSEYLEDKTIDPELNFLNESVHRVLLNKVRFKVGYGDSSERLKPMVGKDLVSPVYLGLKASEAVHD
jgi:aerobactin synthase